MITEMLFTIVYVIVVLLLLRVFWKFAKRVNRAVTVEFLIQYIKLARYSMVPIYCFFAVMASISHATGQAYKEMNDLLFLILVVIPVFLIITYSLSMGCLNWLLADTLIRYYEDNITLDRNTYIEKIIKRRGWFFRWYFGLKNLDFDEIIGKLS